MKLFIIFGLLTVVSGVLAYFGSSQITKPDAPQASENAAVENFAAANRQPVLVELFTSEGCSSCPPADKVLADLEHAQSNPNAEVVALSLHVDYWDSSSWRDPYSQHAFSLRQDIYSANLSSENYTPQMLVDGRAPFVGSDAGRAQKAIAEALKTPKAKIELALENDKLKIKITDAPAHENATVFLAIAEDNLAPSNVRGGENSGRRLAHASVVRELKSLGMLTAEQKNFEMESAVQLQPDWKKENLKLVVFVQENQTRKIFGTGKTSLQ